MLCLAVLTFGAVSFAYLSGTDVGGGNTVTLGEFVFVGESSLDGQTDLRLDTPTIINPVIIESDNANWATDGDDLLFDDFCVPVSLTMTNESRSDMMLSVDVSVTTRTLDPAYEKSVAWVLLPEADETTAAKGYAARIRERTAPFEDKGKQDATAAEGDKLYLCDVALKTFEAANAAANADPQMMFLPRVGSDGVFSTVKLDLCVWIDYRAYKNVANEDGKSAELTLKVTVSATNDTGGAA